MDTLWLRNLAAYILQTSVIVTLGTFLLYALRLRMAKARLLCWQGLLAVCVLLPAIEPWRPVFVDGSVQIAMRTVATAETSGVRSGWSLSWPGAILAILVVGLAWRAILLLAGFWKLRRYRRNSQFLAGAFAELQQRMNVHADFRITEEISTPVTFGIRNPVILFPPGWRQHDAIACHELLHVRRLDWAFTVVEECVRAVLWFHPAIWWVIAQIQLSREETVDQEAVAIMNSREQYLEALLAIAAAKAGLDLVPASLFLRKGHLRKRVAALLREVSMSKSRIIYSLAAFVPAVVLAGWLSVRAFPLQAGEAADDPGVTIESSGPALLHRAAVQYPKAALERHIQGRVTAELTLDEDGGVSDARILSGPEDLRNAVLRSVLRWHYAKDAQLPRTVQVSVQFQASATAMPVQDLPVLAAPLNVVKRFVYRVPDPLRERIESRLTLREGDELTEAKLAEAFRTVRAIDFHINLVMQPGADRAGSLMIFTLNEPESAALTPKRLRIGGNVQATNLITKVTPKYPPEAKAARIQGTVRLSVVIGKDGHVLDVQLVAGDPLLVGSAEEAVWQWIYRPTLLNGNPVEVITQVDVNYTLIR
jgi:TonB family protein